MLIFFQYSSLRQKILTEVLNAFLSFLGIFVGYERKSIKFDFLFFFFFLLFVVLFNSKILCALHDLFRYLPKSLLSPFYL